ncbi:MAG: substrate-binding domain-containing protein [Kiritimatiellia bacterium]
MNTVIVFRSSDSVAFRKKLSGIAEVAHRRLWNLQVVEPVETADAIRDLIRLWRPIGCIVGCGADVNRFPPTAVGRLPLAYIDRPSRQLRKADSCVYHDSAATARLAASELLRLGLDHYAYVRHPEHPAWDAERLAAFSDILRRHGKRVGCFDFAQPGRETRELAKWLKAQPRPLGVLAATDPYAAHTISAARIAGLSVPDDVAVIGIDNEEELCEASNPTLSTVEPDFRAAGRLAAQALVDMLSGKPPARLAYPPLKLLRRGSTCRFARPDADVSRAVERIRREACHGLTAREVVAGFSCGRRMAEIRFRALTGRSILEAIRAVRLTRAKELLAKGALAEDAIANFCGYRSVAAFSVFFKSETGVSPSAYPSRNATG